MEFAERRPPPIDADEQQSPPVEEPGMLEGMAETARGMEKMTETGSALTTRSLKIWIANQNFQTTHPNLLPNECLPLRQWE